MTASDAWLVWVPAHPSAESGRVIVQASSLQRPALESGWNVRWCVLVFLPGASQRSRSISGPGAHAQEHRPEYTCAVVAFSKQAARRRHD